MKTSDSLQDFAYEEIKKRIQNGEYAPGTKLNTQEISDSLGISRSRVLAAINRLIALGLVEARAQPLHSFPIPRLEISLKLVR